jgi:hypothetical protein
MNTFQDFEPLPPLDGAALRTFVRERTAFPWFARDLSVPFVDGLAKRESDDLELRFYVLGAMPVAGGPFGPRMRARQQTILEATCEGWSFGTGHAEPRTRWHVLSRLLGQGEVEVGHGPLGSRYRVTGSGAREVLTPRVCDVLVASNAALSLAWAGPRVMVRQEGRATGPRRDRFVADAVAVLEAVS